MARTNGVYTRPSNSFSNPVTGTPISSADADSTLDDIETALDTINIRDDKFSLLDNGDATKVAKFDVSGVTAGQTRTLTVPDASTTLVGTDTTQELDNKTLDSSVGKGVWTASGTWTLPAITLGGTVTLNGQTLSGAATFNNAISGVTTFSLSSYVNLTEIASPSSPAANDLRVFAKDVGGNTHLFSRDSGGTEVDYTAGAAAAGVSSFNGQTGSITLMTPPQGRLTLTTGVAVTTANVSGAATVYYTPCTGRYVPIYDGTQFVLRDIAAELSLALDSDSGHTNYHQSVKNYDFFVINDGGTIRLGTGPKWDDGAGAGSDTARGTGAASTELEMVQGILTNKNTITIRFGSASGNTVSVPANRATWVGSGRMTANGQIDDSETKRLLYNHYNQAVRSILVTDADTTSNYSTASWQQANANAANQAAVLRGTNNQAMHMHAEGTASSSTATFRSVFIGIGIDSTTVNSARTGPIGCSSTLNAVLNAVYDGYPGLGYHYLAWLEQGAGADTQTWYYTVGDIKSGLTGWCVQ